MRSGPWKPGTALFFESCSAAYSEADQPAVMARISRNKAFFKQGPFQCTP